MFLLMPCTCVVTSTAGYSNVLSSMENAHIYMQEMAAKCSNSAWNLARIILFLLDYAFAGTLRLKYAKNQLWWDVVHVSMPNSGGVFSVCLHINCECHCLSFYYPGQKKRPLRLCIKSEHCSYHAILAWSAWSGDWQSGAAIRDFAHRCTPKRNQAWFFDIPW